MFSKRKNALRLVEDDDLDDASVEEIVLSDHDINELFTVYKKGSKPNTNKNSKSNKNTKSKKVKSTGSKVTVENILERSYETTNKDLNIQLDSDDEIDLIVQPVKSIPVYKSNKSNNSNNSNKSSKSNEDDDDDDIICVSGSENSSAVNKTLDLSDDICIIDSGPSVSNFRSRGRPKRALNLNTQATGLRRSETSTPSKLDNGTRTNSSFANYSMNSSFDTAELDPEMVAQFKFVKTLRLKFKFKGSYKCIEFKSTDKFKDKLDEMCKVLEVSASSLLLMFNDKPISFENTPEELNIGICDIIDVYEKKQNLNQNQNRKEEDPNLFKFKFRDRESRKRVEDIILTMNRYDTFEQIFKNYAELKQIPQDKITFEFDGEIIQSCQKPDDLEMESDYLIDVKIKN